jgi:hypothetical protein
LGVGRGQKVCHRELFVDFLNWLGIYGQWVILKVDLSDKFLSFGVSSIKIIF